MNLDAFLEDRGQDWAELEELGRRARRRPARLGGREVRRLGTLYRSAVADLAVARRRYPADPVRVRLETLVSGSRHLVYASSGRRRSLRTFIAHRYWARVKERPALLAVAGLLLFGPAVPALVWGLADPGAAAGLVPAEFRTVTEPQAGGDLGLSVDEQTELAAAIFTNNIRVSFVAFAGGMTAGVVTALVLGFNAVFLGAVTGLAVGAGNGPVLAELVVPHGVLELSCIVVAGAAGLRLGWAIIDPGLRTRAAALAEEGRATGEMALGTAAWLVVAGLVEGYVTPAGWGLGPAVAVGAGLGVVFWALVLRAPPLRPEPGSWP